MSMSKKKDIVIVPESVEILNPNSEVPVVAALPQLDFNSWWLLAQRKHKLSPSLKNAVYLHFAARGFLDSKDFDSGLEDFGVKS